jgi:hypothetical protein
VRSAEAETTPDRRLPYLAVELAGLFTIVLVLVVNLLKARAETRAQSAEVLGD